MKQRGAIGNLECWDNDGKQNIHKNILVINGFNQHKVKNLGPKPCLYYIGFEFQTSKVSIIETLEPDKAIH